MGSIGRIPQTRKVEHPAGPWPCWLRRESGKEKTSIPPPAPYLARVSWLTDCLDAKGNASHCILNAGAGRNCRSLECAPNDTAAVDDRFSAAPAALRSSLGSV